MKFHTRRRERRGHRGAVAVEAALITPILIALLFGIIEYGFVFKDSLSVTSSTRAGVRLASAEPRIATFAADAAAQVSREGTALQEDQIQEVWVYKAGTDGYPTGSPGAFTSCDTCVKFHWVSSGETSALVAYSDSWPSTTQNACPGSALRDSVGVYVKYRYDAVVGLFFSTFIIEDHAVMSLEPMPTSTGCSA